MMQPTAQAQPAPVYANGTA
jgi:hypothetical protein